MKTRKKTSKEYIACTTNQNTILNKYKWIINHNIWRKISMQQNIQVRLRQSFIKYPSKKCCLMQWNEYTTFIFVKFHFLHFYTNQISLKMIKVKMCCYGNGQVILLTIIVAIMMLKYCLFIISPFCHLSDGFQNKLSSNTEQNFVNMCFSYLVAECTNYAFSFGSSNLESCFSTKIHTFFNLYRSFHRAKTINLAGWHAIGKCECRGLKECHV